MTPTLLADIPPLLSSEYLSALYEDYLSDPETVDARWREWFARLEAVPPLPVQGREIAMPLLRQCDSRQVYVLQLINAYRFQGYLAADLDPLHRLGENHLADLDPVTYGFKEDDLETEFDTGSLVAPPRLKLREILDILRATYCGRLGAEYMHITDTRQKRWLQNRLEGTLSDARLNRDEKLALHSRLIHAETLEKFLHTRYVGQKRFSLEGSESLIPLLDELIVQAGDQGVEEIVLGMAHRGRINVLTNILGKPPIELFDEQLAAREGLLAGDVKYHQGFSANVMVGERQLHVALAFNPSHLEIVDPVVEGSVRARQHAAKDVRGNRIIPLLVHGDAAFAGQGVVTESLNMSVTRGFGTGGTVHVVVNNQIGFTTSDPRDSRSTLYCTDVAKMVEAPVLHANGDDPESVVLAARIAMDYRMTFNRDVVIDLVCFRRLGHNEQDDPMVTQPLMYRRIAAHSGVRTLYTERLVKAEVLNADDVAVEIDAVRGLLDRNMTPARINPTTDVRPLATNWKPYRGKDWRTPVQTAVALSHLKTLAHRLTTVPEGFTLHQRVAALLEDRRRMGEGELPLDWGMAENLAYATLLTEGYGVRISGQDSGRGTFFHRHAVLHDQKRERWDAGVYVPLQNLTPDQASFFIVDSMLSEEAVLGFEYGYATSSPNELVIWEAQFGDFANGAQVVIDQFIAAGEAKWGRLCGLTLFLPHGYEGQGPEHSSGRIERYMQLSADDNIQVCQPTTPAQFFHLLRRQVLRPYRRPLVVFTPKSLLRHKDSVSGLDELAEGGFRLLLDDAQAEPLRVKRVAITTGRIHFDLLAARRERQAEDLALVRIEQLYPFPRDELRAVLARYEKAHNVFWAQDEPQNQGAYYHILHHLRECLGPGQKLFYAGPPHFPAPAFGYLSLHRRQQREILATVFGG
jgi:2-oxoglutarate dehydrogenase E1 component